MSTKDNLPEIRYFTGSEPYNISLDNRPLQDLKSGLDYICDTLDTGIPSGELTAIGTYVDNGSTTDYTRISANRIMIVNSAAGSNAKRWDVTSETNNILSFRTLTDALGSSYDWMTVTRSGASVTSVALSIGGTITADITSTGLSVTGRVSADRVIPGFATQATAGATTTLTSSSKQQQEFTGTLNQTVTLPVTSTLSQGQGFTIINNTSTGLITVNSSGGNLVWTIPPLVTISVVCVLASGTTAASWSVSTSGSGQLLGTAQSKAIFWNAQTIAENITIESGRNAFSSGPISIAGGFAVTIETGATWKII